MQGNVIQSFLCYILLFRSSRSRQTTVFSSLIAMLWTDGPLRQRSHPVRCIQHFKIFI